MKITREGDDNVDLRDIQIVKKRGGTMDDIELSEGLLFADNKISKSANGPRRIENAKIAVIKFQIASPKTNLEANVVIGDYTKIDKVLKQEKKYIIGLVKKIAKSGANVLLIQQSVLKEAVNDLSLHFLAKKKIMVITDVDRKKIDFVCKTLGCMPVAHIDQLTPDKLGKADLVEEAELNDGSKILKISGTKSDSKTLSILIRGTNKLLIDEAERSIHDALCVVRCLVKNKSIIPGGGAPEIEISQKLEQYASTLTGVKSLVISKFAQSLEVIPSTLAENSGMNPILVVTELRNRHKHGKKNCGVNAKTGILVDDAIASNIMQPTLVTESALTLATEVVRMILKIDDLVLTR